jgi:hypothetical protein
MFYKKSNCILYKKNYCNNYVKKKLYVRPAASMVQGGWVVRAKKTAYNRSVYASPPYGGSGYEKPQSACGLCTVFLRHILARRNATHCFMGGPKRRKQPERYVQCALKLFGNINSLKIIGKPLTFTGK